MLKFWKSFNFLLINNIIIFSEFRDNEQEVWAFYANPKAFLSNELQNLSSLKSSLEILMMLSLNNKKGKHNWLCHDWLDIN